MIAQVRRFQLNIFEDLIEKTWSDDFACMNRDHGAAAIRMLEKMMTASDADHSKSRIAKGSD